MAPTTDRPDRPVAVVPTDIANGLADILAKTAEIPYLGRCEYRHRLRVEREYREIHQAAKALDEWLRGWKSTPIR